LEQLKEMLVSLDARRKKLGIPINILARRAGMSRATLLRLLKGKAGKINPARVFRIAEAMGARVDFGLTYQPEEEYVREQAKKQAHFVIEITQANMSMECQGLDMATLQELEKN